MDDRPDWLLITFVAIIVLTIALVLALGLGDILEEDARGV